MLRINIICIIFSSCVKHIYCIIVEHQNQLGALWFGALAPPGGDPGYAHIFSRLRFDVMNYER